MTGTATDPKVGDNVTSHRLMGSAYLLCCACDNTKKNKKKSAPFSLLSRDRARLGFYPFAIKMQFYNLKSHLIQVPG